MKLAIGLPVTGLVRRVQAHDEAGVVFALRSPPESPCAGVALDSHRFMLPGDAAVLGNQL
jgi:hypothetical protein